MEAVQILWHYACFVSAAQGVWVGSFLDVLVPIMVACGTLAGRSAVMVLLVDLGSLQGIGF